jgi:hypothetical protein
VPVHFSGGRARVWLLLAALLLTAGCATSQWSAGLPDVQLQKPASGARKIGVAQAEDSRPDYVIGSVGRAELLAGPELPNHIERKFRNGLTERGFDPIEALDPADTAISQPYKVLVVTLQSAHFSWSGHTSGTTASAIGIALQVYSPAHKLIFSSSYSGDSTDTTHFISTSVVAGRLIASAADHAVSAAFADPKFEQALR